MDIKTLVKVDLIAAAKAAYSAHLATKNRHATALEQRRAALREAERIRNEALADAAVSGDSAAATAARKDFQAAAEALADEEQVAGALEARSPILRTAIEDAKRAAWQPVMDFAKAESIAACRDFEAALAAIQGAVARKEAASAVARTAERGGCPLPGDGGMLAVILNHFSRPQPPAFAKLLNTPAREAALWDGATT